VPIYYNHKNSGRPAGNVGEFLVRYVDLPHGPLYPFGFGLSYTSFSYSDLQVEKAEYNAGLNHIWATLTNSGPRRGTEIVQLYVRDLVGSITRPVKELKGFQRVTLEPGESARVVFKLKPEDLVFTGLDGQPRTEPGDFYVWVGPNSSEGLQGAFKLVG
jgi:beta-glucosidase